MLVAILTACVLKAAPSSLSVTVPGMSIPDALELISDLTGLELKAKGSAAHGTLVVSVKDVQTERLLDRIAEVTGAVWEVENDVRYLTVPVGLAQDQRRDEVEKKAVRFSSVIEKIIEQLPAWNEQSATRLAEDAAFVANDYYNSRRRETIGERRVAVFGAMPASRLVPRLLAAIDPIEIASVKPGQAVVYSTSPNRMQRAFPREAQELFAEHKRQFSATRLAVLETTKELPVTEVFDPRHFFVEGLGEPVKYVLTIVNQADRPLYRITLDVVDADGWIVDQGFARPGNLDIAPSAMGEWQQGAIELSEVALDYYELVRYYHIRNTPRGKLSSELRTKYMAQIVDTAKTDPLSWLQAEMLTDVAEVVGADLVACIPDDSMVWLGHFLEHPTVRQSMSVSEVVQTIEQNWTCTVQFTDGWLTVRPVSFVDAREAYLDRDVLQIALRQAAGDERVTLANLASYGATQTSHLALTMADERLLAVVSGRRFGNMVYYNRLPLKFLGKTGVLNKPGPNKVYRFNTASLTKEAREALETWAFGDSWQNTFGLDYMWDSSETDMAHPLGHISKRPTEAMPGGVPSNVTGTIDLTTNPGLAVDFLAGEFQDTAPVVWSFDSYPSYSIDQMAEERSTRVQEVEQLFVRIEFMLKPQLGLVSDMKEDPIISSDRWVDIGQLPRTVVDYWRTQFEKAKVERTAATQKPPPR